MRWCLISCLPYLMLLSGCQSYSGQPVVPAQASTPARAWTTTTVDMRTRVPAPVVARPMVAPNLTPVPAVPADDPAATCVIYPLRDLGGDAQLATWLAETIPQVIEPKSWLGAGGIGKLCCNAPAQVLIVHHTPATQRKVAAFLDNMKRSLPTDRVAARSGAVLPAKFVELANAPPSPSGPALPYPVPAPGQQPKHLFHFIIRYEGDGIIDPNVVDFVKMMQGMANGDAPSTAPQAPPTCVPSANVAPALPQEASPPKTVRSAATPAAPPAPPAGPDNALTRQQIEQLIRAMTGAPIPILPSSGGSANPAGATSK